MQPVMAHRIVNWGLGRHSPPWELMVCPTHRCNLRCGICARSWEDTTAGELFDELPEQRWLDLMDEAEKIGVKYLNIGGGGEPTLRSELVLNLCAKGKECGMAVHLQTNGTTLTRADISQLIKLRVDYITVSLDGPVAEINDAIRFKNAYAETVKNIQLLVALKKECHSAFPRLQINMVVTALNFHALEAMVDFCVDNSVEYLSAKTLLEYSPNMTAYILSPEQEGSLPGKVEKAAARACAAGLAHNLETLLSSKSWQAEPLNAQDGISHRQVRTIAEVRCLEPWRGLVVSSSGHVAPCCFFWDGTADSVREKSLEEVWLGPYLTSFRQRMRNGELPAPCTTCGFPDSRDHVRLAACVSRAEAEAERGMGFRSPAVFLRKAWNSLRRHGVLSSLRRYREWRAVQRALRNEPK